MSLGRFLGILFLLSSTLAADVVVLKDGNRVAGKVVEKYERGMDCASIRKAYKAA